MVEAKTKQAASQLDKNARRFIGNCGTTLVGLLKKHVNSPRVINVVGKYKKRYLVNFSQDTLENIGRVNIVLGNQLTKSLAGRMELADKLLQYGLVASREELLTLLETGQFEMLTNPVEAELNLVHAENEWMMEGKGMPDVPLTDNHMFHIKTHVALLADPMMRFDESIMQVTLAHVSDHIQKLTGIPAEMMPTQVAGLHYNAILGHQIPPHLQPILDMFVQASMSMLAPPPPPGAGGEGVPPEAPQEAGGEGPPAMNVPADTSASSASDEAGMELDNARMEVQQFS